MAFVLSKWILYLRRKKQELNEWMYEIIVVLFWEWKPKREWTKFIHIRLPSETIMKLNQWHVFKKKREREWERTHTNTHTDLQFQWNKIKYRANSKMTTTGKDYYSIVEERNLQQKKKQYVSKQVSESQLSKISVKRQLCQLNRRQNTMTNN